ncbi:MAG TPA: hypothetical protein V6C65_26170 [Allocoleopsis sp.]
MAKGHKTGGRKKGTPNKQTLKFRDLLEKNSVDFEQQLAQAILTKDVDLIKALKDLLPYLQPRLTVEVSATPEPTPEGPDLSDVSTADLLKLVKKP